MGYSLPDYLKHVQRAREFASQRQLTERQLELLLRMHSNKMGPLNSCQLNPEEYARRSIGIVLAPFGDRPANLHTDIKYLYKERGYIDKVINPHNERQISLALTSEGVQLCQDAEAHLSNTA